MTSAISLWFYQLQPYPERGRSPTPAEELPGMDFGKFLNDFVASFAKVSQDNEKQRIWYFDPPAKNTRGEIDGYIKYGVYGFESDLIDSKTKKHRYKRQVADYEQIDLYYQIWWPDAAKGAIIAFQSFQGRSCIGLVNQALIDAFRQVYSGYTLRVRKLMPDNLSGSVFAGAPVQAISLVARHVHADRRRNYGSSKIPDEIEVSVRIAAKKQGSFGPLGKLDKTAMAKLSLPVWLIGEDTFDKATAEIEWLGRRRKVGVFGYSNDSGHIDVTEDIVIGKNGHPTFDSLRAQTDDLIGSFAHAIGFTKS